MDTNYEDECICKNPPDGAHDTCEPNPEEATVAVPYESMAELVNGGAA